MPQSHRLNKFTLACLLFFSISTFAQTASPIIQTRQGWLRGVIENGIPVFKGIPYAAPPVGDLRFMPPVEHATWTDTLHADKFGSMAMQASGKKAVGSEDCLFLNVYTPACDAEKRAVVVWVHGGSMTAGSGSGMDGHAFADHDDIVTVTINYRLGVFGFMYLGDLDKRYAASGNNGLLDVVAALKWIKQNIAGFGGDPKRVTIMGESAGAKLISAVICSPQSKGLFQQYIAESGSVQCIRDSVTAKNERLKVLHQIKPAENDARLLLNLPADSLIHIQARSNTGISGTSFFGPVIDGVALTKDPYRYAADHQLSRFRALVGANKTEALLFTAMDGRYKHPDSSLFRDMFGDDAPPVYKSYQVWSKAMSPEEAAVKTLTQYMYQMHTYRFAKALNAAGNPVWMYRFDYAKLSLGAAHASELAFVWYKPASKEFTDSAKKQLALQMHAAWVSFIKTGDPNNPSLPNWPRYEQETKEVMLFDEKSRATPITDVFDDKTFPSAVFVLK
jgi:para-nitrobenzyl esterase